METEHSSDPLQRLSDAELANRLETVNRRIEWTQLALSELYKDLDRNYEEYAAIAREMERRGV